MLIMAIDPGKRIGVATGVAGDKPRVEAVALRGKQDDVGVQAANLAVFLRDRWTLELPDLVVIERTDDTHYLSADAILSQVYSHGALHAIAGCFGIRDRIRKVAASTARLHFCGQASAAPRRQQKRTPAQKRQDRIDTNNMVLRRAILLGYLPHGCADWEKASASCLFDYAAAEFARAPRSLVLFGEGDHRK